MAEITMHAWSRSARDEAGEKIEFSSERLAGLKFEHVITALRKASIQACNEWGSDEGLIIANYCKA